MRLKQGRNMLRALTANGKQREPHVLRHLLPVVEKVLRWGKSGVGTRCTPCRPPTSPPDHPPRPRKADCTLYIRLLSGKKTMLRSSQIHATGEHTPPSPVNPFPYSLSLPSRSRLSSLSRLPSQLCLPSLVSLLSLPNPPVQVHTCLAGGFSWEGTS